jgi:hypothetical protein
LKSLVTSFPANPEARVFEKINLVERLVKVERRFFSEKNRVKNDTSAAFSQCPTNLCGLNLAGFE